MTPARFLETRRAPWDRLEALIAKATKQGLRGLTEAELHELTRLYPAAAVDVARARMYQVDLGLMCISFGNGRSIGPDAGGGYGMVGTEIHPDQTKSSGTAGGRAPSPQLKGRGSRQLPRHAGPRRRRPRRRPSHGGCEGDQ